MASAAVVRSCSSHGLNSSLMTGREVRAKRTGIELQKAPIGAVLARQERDRIQADKDEWRVLISPLKALSDELGPVYEQFGEQRRKVLERAQVCRWFGKGDMKPRTFGHQLG